MNPLDFTDPNAGWDVIEKEGLAAHEKTRCLNIVRIEIQVGTARGVPETSGVMKILHRIAAAIENG